MSYLQPHLKTTVNQHKQTIALINLLEANFSFPYLTENKYLESALHALKKRFFQILESEGFKSHSLIKAILVFDFSPYAFDDYACDCYALIISTSGKKYIHGVNWIGNSIFIPEEITIKFSNLNT